MCGRTACTLSKDQVQKACARRDRKSGKYKELQWVDSSNGGHEYNPSYNVCPTDVTPVIVATCNTDDLVLKPMMWGIIPPWHKGAYNGHKLSTNNCRIENILNSKLYKPPLERGQRCVVICDGFYEWQTTKKVKVKQPYFIYSPQSEGIKIDDPESWPNEFSADEGWKGPNLLFMAALFSSWLSPEGEEFLTYSIITMESDEGLSWLHHRTPAILKSEDAISGWLNKGISNPSEALSLLLPVRMLEWHPVATDVNNSRNKCFGLNKEVSLEEKEKKPLSKSANLMQAWLQKGKPAEKRSNEITEKQEVCDKKPKISPNNK